VVVVVVWCGVVPHVDEWAARGECMWLVLHSRKLALQRCPGVRACRCVHARALTSPALWRLDTSCVGDDGWRVAQSLGELQQQRRGPRRTPSHAQTCNVCPPGPGPCQSA
jgi:hypothetical protein